MSDQEIHDALERAADVVPERDLSQTAWYAGRSRRRCTSRAWWGAGAAAAAAALVGVIAWNGGTLSLPDSGPAGTAGDESGQTTTAEPPHGADEQVMRGQPTVLALTSEDGELEHSGVLHPWTADSGSATSWRLMDPVSEQPVFVDGPGITLTFDGTTWALRGCGLAMQAPGTVTAGRIEVTGDWDIEPDPDPGASCVWHDWLDAERWQEFLDSAPLVSQDGTTLLLSGALREQPVLDRVAVGFARADVADPQVGPSRAATWDDLAQGWDEAPVDDLTARIPGPAFADTETDPEADVQVTSPGIGDLSLTGCDGTGFSEAWLLDTGEAAVFLAPNTLFTADLCVGPGQKQQSLVTSLLMGEGALSVHGDYLVIEGWLNPQTLDPQPPVADTRPKRLLPPTQLPDPRRLTPAESLLPEVLEVPTGDLPTLAQDPTDQFVVALVRADSDSSLLVLGSDQRWRTAATDVRMVSPDPRLLMAADPLLRTSISPQGEWLAYRRDTSVVILTASTGAAREVDTDGTYPRDLIWLDDDQLLVDLGEGGALLIDGSTGQTTSDASWSQARALTPWQITVQHSEDDITGAVVLQERDAAGELVEETPLGFTGVHDGDSISAQDRDATVITTQDETAIEPDGQTGETPGSASLVLAWDGTGSLNVLQVDPELGARPVHWVGRGDLIVRRNADGGSQYLLWDTQNGGLDLLTQLEDGNLSVGPVFGDIGHPGD